MAELKEYLSNIAEAIRTKKGTTEKINAQDFASEIITIESSINPVEILTEQEMLAETKAENLGAVFKYVGATGAYTQGEYYKVVQVEAVHIPYLGYPYYVIMYEPSNKGFRIVWRATPGLDTYGDSWYNDGLVSSGVSRWNYYVSITGKRYISNIYSTLPEAVTAIQSADTTYTYTVEGSTYIYENGSTAIYNDTLVFYSNFSGEITYSSGDATTTFTENPLLTDTYTTTRIYAPKFQEKSVNATTVEQNITPDTNYDGLSSVTVGAVEEYDDEIEISGSEEGGNIQPLTITENGVYEVEEGVSGYAPVTVEVASTDTLKALLDETKSANYLFASYKGTNIDGLISYNTTENVTDMSSMFNTCNNLTTVPLFDTSNVTNMRSMFNTCNNLTTVPLFDTSNVTNMSSMFSVCIALTTVPLFDTSNVTDMSSMFYSCKFLTVPLFDTSNVTNMRSMFRNCNNLTTVPLFDTSNVTDMSSMFEGCKNLTTVPLFDTSNVTNMSSMFYSCNNLTSVPLFDTSNVTNMNYMFNGCSSLTTVKLQGVSSKITSSSTCFYGCTSLELIDFRGATGVPTLSSTNAFTNVPSTCKVVIPDDLYDTWTNATNWSAISVVWVKESEYVEE